MRLVRYDCPRCGQQHRIGLLPEHGQCVACAQPMALKPNMFSSTVFQIVFISGALGLGVALGSLRWSLGMLPYDLDQFVLDMVCFWIYAWISRIVYFQFQSVTINL
jgi:hypothetical protein